MAKDITVSGEGGKDFDPVPAGPTVGIAYAIYDVGTIHDDKWGKDKHEIIISYELPSERIKVKDKVTGEEKDMPRAISSRYTKSLGEKANLRKDLESWRGKPFTDAEIKMFSLKNILGKAGLLNITHKPKDGGGVWANITSLMPLLKGTTPPKAENPLVLWEIGDATDGVPAFILKRAMQAKEWDVKDAQHQEAPPEEQSGDDQEIPF